MDFEQLPREIPLPMGLENRTVAALRRQGLLGQNQPHSSRTWQRVAASLVIFAAGAWVGAAWDAPADSPVPGSARFLLLLEGAATVSATDESRVFEEYRAWALQLRRSGRYVSGERLGAESIAVPGDAGSVDQIQGYFVVSANDMRDAVAVAESSPHVARGGLVRVRPIDTQ